MEKERGITIINVDKKKQCDIHVVVKSFFCNNERSKDGKCFEQCGVCSEYASR